MDVMMGTETLFSSEKEGPLTEAKTPALMEKIKQYLMKQIWYKLF